MKEVAAKSFGHIVRRHRQLRSMTQEQLAEAAGVHRTFIGTVERGETNVTLLTLLKFAEALHLRPEELVSELEVDGTLRSEAALND